MDFSIQLPNGSQYIEDICEHIEGVFSPLRGLGLEVYVEYADDSGASVSITNTKGEVVAIVFPAPQPGRYPLSVDDWVLVNSMREYAFFMAHVLVMEFGFELVLVDDTELTIQSTNAQQYVINLE